MVVSFSSGSIFFYDYCNYYKVLFLMFDFVKVRGFVDLEMVFRGWMKLEFFNDGKYIFFGL